MQASKERNSEPMKKESLGMMIASLRKENGMTQLELAAKMGVTDKAVSKWERDLSCPDVNTIPKLAEVFRISVDELMQVRAESDTSEKKDIGTLIQLILRALALAMGGGMRHRALAAQTVRCRLCFRYARDWPCLPCHCLIS